MKCPFRADAVYEYEKIKGQNGIPDFLQTKQRTEFSDCYEEECPYYCYPNGCLRISED